jgi:hypothetical protein
MTVKAPKQKMANMDDEEWVTVMLENGSGSQFFDVVEVSSQRGTPVRSSDGEAGCRFESEGAANWTFIEIEKA